uniref:G protein-coupled receptor 152 n=1 Tax=Pelusios castaneus TaxID=367368 RepID=A0A8C8S7T7_9SAUR
MRSLMMAKLSTTSLTPTEFETSTPPIWQAAFLIGTVTLGLPANAFIIWLTGWKLRHRRGLSVFILSLATSDFLFLACSVLQIQETIMKYEWLLDRPMCQVRHFIIDLCYHCSLFLLATLSVDRCLMVLLPLWYRCHRPLRLPTYICLGTWLLAALLTIKGFIFAKVYMPHGFPICTIDRGSYEKPLRLLEVLLEGLFPFIIIMTTHAATLAYTFRRHTQPPTQFYCIVAATLSAYVLLNLPFQITQLIFLAKWKGELIPFMVYFGYLINLGSAVNPFIYILFGSNICKGCGSSLATALTEESGKSSQDTPALPLAQVHPDCTGGGGGGILYNCNAKPCVNGWCKVGLDPGQLPEEVTPVPRPSLPPYTLQHISPAGTDSHTVKEILSQGLCLTDPCWPRPSEGYSDRPVGHGRKSHTLCVLHSPTHVFV